MQGNQNSQSHQSIRSRQIIALKQLINLNHPVSQSIAAEPVWKILIFDRYGQDIISPLLTVKDLRDLGVTLHLLLDSIREPLPDVPAVYFVLPSEENVRVICQDFAAGLYESYFLNFISAINRPRLEDLATTAVTSSSVAQVQKVFDQYLNFVSLEDDLFTLRKHSPDCPLSYYGINRRDMNESSMSEILDSIVDGLFSVCVTLGVVPIIRCPKNGAAEQVSERLDKKLRENLRDARSNLFTTENVRAGQLSFQRPVLIIADRGMDLATMLHHTWTYQALVHDVLELELNRVVLRELPSTPLLEQRPSKQKVKEYDLNAADKFWLKNRGRVCVAVIVDECFSPFPVVAEAVQEELESYRNSEEEIKKLKHAMGLDAEADEAISMISDTTERLTSTVSSLPELLEKKRLIDLHTNVATAVLDQIKARKLDGFFETEEKLLNRQMPDRPIIEFLKDPESGSAEDKIRLALLHYILTDHISEQEMSQYILALEAAGAQDAGAAFKFVKLWKSIEKGFSRDQYTGGGTKTVSMFSKLLNQSSQLVMEGVKNLVIKKHNLPLTKVVDAIMEMKSIPEIEDYRYFDPKVLRSAERDIPRNRSPFHDCIVFVIGGGNYVEYQNLVDYGKTKSTAVGKRITYGCTDLANAAEFLAQLARLGNEM